MDGWQDIATAPNDGEHVLVVAGGFMYVAYQDEYGWCVFGGLGVDDVELFEIPTHWMSLPDLPEHAISLAEEGEMRPEP